VIAEVDGDAIRQRVTDGYILQENVYADLGALIERLEACREAREAVCLIYHGNIVDLWERFARDHVRVELGSDQTSCHNIHDMGYCPADYTFEEAKQLLIQDKAAFLEAVAQSLRRHAAAVNELCARGMYFWDYGNAFLKEAGDVGAAVFKPGEQPLKPGEIRVIASPYRYPSYVEDILGPLCFDYGFGPFRWVCCSGDPADLEKTDRIAGEVLDNLLQEAPEEIQGQIRDNILWIRNAQQNLPVVGSYSRILYADSEGRMRISKAFNDAIARGELAGPVVLGRDHHDVSGTDSPFRETANIYDGSRYTADMAVHNAIGDSFRGATWVSLHNGGGVGWGEVINGGFGLVLDGSPEAERRLHAMLFWDVNNGIARRAWARNPHAISTLSRTMEAYPELEVTTPFLADARMVEEILKG
jgi:urocanate hydratase